MTPAYLDQKPPVLADKWVLPSFDFELPPVLEAGEPPEARGLRRDQVGLLVSYYGGNDRYINAQFNQIPDFLEPGDILVINTSGTLSASLNVTNQEGEPFELHLSTHLPGGSWVVELRKPSSVGSLPHFSAEKGQIFNLPGGGRLTLISPYRFAGGSVEGMLPKIRLWTADLQTPKSLEDTLEQFGFPIRYKYAREEWPQSYYQTVYATHKGSAEMPSAGRAFTPELITALVAKGVQVIPLLLHTGVASLEEGEPPYDEYFNVPAPTAQIVNLARENGRRVIAVGTTTVRALESAVDTCGIVYPTEGWTDLVITPHRGLYAVDGLLTGFHEPKSSHLAMLAALAGFDYIRRAYEKALEGKYLWHEFGDLHLLLPEETVHHIR